MLLLAFDTATPAVTAAVHDGTAVLAELYEVDARRHGELLLPTVDEVLRRAGVDKRDLTDIAVGVGPGPYTGLRVGLVTAAALGHALGLPVHGVCTLDAIAHQARAEGLTGPFTVATDARRKEVYWASYDAEGRRTAGPDVHRPAELSPEVQAVGAGALLYPDSFPGATGPEHVSAGALADFVVTELAAGRELLPNRPLYLRRPDAQVPAGYKAVLPA
ncbi:tRNA (adenosine(37)-N6)-threonylcarbamoyltransferase complex dimerization subunit type 1 TsaB [Kitasatospora sp. MMS16-BH015]|uniref:tRNA (adenosine(37)-N6)-threonylcarbamoyltransferase complex dimerization subunit type 1 TsaB n=1 Tax=Kitasatospora sp. MMS16-BH015 TaxID=2018025 RepID=UPI000CA1D332|nr:tRNA (adenosine(37)-N6)-threonylcarbamoyltransferase complex dimerization subunit type 1 TsaB [Kitasatospora sp. MMS16-BH015]AUG77725.1 tRNA (adenosine(37)-N6)-threonylcarbamoyltransferase complex dimerization subunit type 1 TsaB [Kitasatospora sp. MMS16-BH015]